MFAALLFAFQDPKLDVAGFDALLQRAGEDSTYAQKLEGQVRNWFGADLAKGNPKVHETDVVWALEANSVPTVVADDGTALNTIQTTPHLRGQVRLRRIGTGNVWAAVSPLNSGDGFSYHYEVAGKPVAHGFVEVYKTPAECSEQPGVAKGKLERKPDWSSHVFEGTTREWYVYIPAVPRLDEPIPVMVFQDGQWMKNYVPVVFDNLIAKGEMPPTVGIFLAPGVFKDGRSNRSFEYDTLSDQYVRFLLEEILPEVEKSVKLRKDPGGRAICGMSSGGICAFTAAWERPDQFGKVLSWIGSFTNIASGPSGRAGGHNYPAMIRLTPKKPIRVFLQDGANDLDNKFGNWPLANQEMAKALAFAGYDYRFEFGKGNHSDKHGRALLPDSLRWLWR
jgi:enterochelin esterase family protein